MNKSDWIKISPHLDRLKNRTAFDLSAECIVMTDEGNAMETSLSGLSTHLNASAALASPSMVAYALLAKEVGAEKAMNQLLIELGEDAEEFCEAWKQAKTDIANGAKATIDDVVRMIGTAKVGFDAYPRKILVVSTRKAGADMWLVSNPANDLR